MQSLRSIRVMRSVAVRPFPRTAIRSTVPLQQRLYAQQSYGGADDDPKGGKPQEQGSNPSANLEHPGPPPPDVGQGSGGGPTKAGKEGHNTQQNESTSSGSSSGSSSSSSSSSKKSTGAQPKIHDEEDVPTDHSEEVKAHNEEMKNRHDRAATTSEGEQDKVEKGFWKGHGGADRES